MAKLSELQISLNKQEFISLLSTVKRQGMDKLITWLEEKSDFFIAPSSGYYHGAYEGGLCQHSLNVYHALKKMLEASKELALPENQLDNITEDTLIISALLHDLCKVNFYKKEIKVFKDEDTNSWKHYYTYNFEDTFPVGHGEKSVIMAQNFINLSISEILAIRWHMGFSDPGMAVSSYERPAFNRAVNVCPLVVLLQNADTYASFMMEPMFDAKKENLLD